MRTVKMFGLAAMVAITAMAFLGAASSSATVLCKETPAAGTDCQTPIANGTSLSFSSEPGTSALLKGPFGETIGTCTESLVEGSTGTAGSTTETVKVTISRSTEGPFGDTPPCTWTVTATGTWEFHSIAGTNNATVTWSGWTVVIHNTPLFGTCQYSTSATDIGTLTDKLPSAPTLDISAKLKSENGCPEATWTGSYIGTSEAFGAAAG